MEWPIVQISVKLVKNSMSEKFFLSCPPPAWAKQVHTPPSVIPKLSALAMFHIVIRSLEEPWTTQHQVFFKEKAINIAISFWLSPFFVHTATFSHIFSLP
jgi:hypothetical protein